MRQFDPLRVLKLNENLSKYAMNLHVDENFNELCSVALSSFVMQSHPDERQCHAIVSFLRHLTTLGSPETVPPVPLTAPQLIPPEQISKIMEQERIRSESIRPFKL